MLLWYRPNLEVTQKSKKTKKVKTYKKKVSSKPQKQQQQKQKQKQEEDAGVEESRYVGCFASESSFLGMLLYNMIWYDRPVYGMIFYNII